MTFTTLTFFVFTIVVFAAYWQLPNHRWQNALLLVANYVFYGWWDWRFCFLMAASCSVDFWIARGIASAASPVVKRRLLSASVTISLCVLGFFKYCDFFAENITTAMAALGWSITPWTLQVLLPLGISFHTFQSMAYVIDVYRGKTTESKNWIEYLAYVSFFPQLVAGPIERAADTLVQFQIPRRFDEATAIEGCRLMLWGFFKKLVLADGLSLIADAAFTDVPGATGPQLLVGTFAFAVQIYCDFSAYSDIAAGVARLFGFHLMRNFAYPYFSQSVGEFWRRWHISLSTWFRDYVFIPLGGSRRGPTVLIRNLMATFLISGLWHGASWKFVAWGGLMGIAVTLETLFAKISRPQDDKIPGGSASIPSLGTVLRIGYVMSAISIGWVFFRAPDIVSAGLALGKMATEIFSPAAWTTLAAVFPASKAGESAALLPAFLLFEWSQRTHWSPLAILDRYSLTTRWTVYTVLLWTILLTAPDRDAQFIYFQF